jgi:hypothetical protein
VSPQATSADPTGGRSANPADCVRTGLGDGLAQAMTCWDWTRDDIGVTRGGASDKTIAQPKGFRGNLGLRFRWPPSGPYVGALSGRDRMRERPRLRLVRLDGRGHCYILASANGRVALASRRVIGTEVS